MNLKLKWRLFKELLHRPVCWWKGHSPTMLEDDETIYCERCGKVLGTIKHKVATDEAGQRFLDISFEPTQKTSVKPYATHRTSKWLQSEHIKTKELLKQGRKSGLTDVLLLTPEEHARRHWLPEPKTHRRTRTHTHTPPAERHRDAISKAMKGKGHFSKHYRRTIRSSSGVPIEEEEND